MFNDNKLKDLQAEVNRLNQEAADLFYDKAWRNEIAQEVGREVYYGFDHMNMVDLVTETERLGLNETATIDLEIRGLTAFHIARGGVIEESTIHGETAYLPKDQIGIHIREHVDRIQTNFVPSVQKLVSLAPRRIDAEINRRVISTLQAAIPSSSAYYVSTANVTLTQVQTALDAVRNEVEPEAGDPVIIGRSAMLNKLRNATTNGLAFNYFMPSINEDQLRYGETPNTLFGARVLDVGNYRDENGRSYFPNNELWIVGRSAGKTAFYGTPRTTEWIEDEGEYWHWQTRLNYGVSIVRPSHARRIVDASVSA